MLRELFEKLELGEVEGMNLLQNAGLISDNCIKIDDISFIDVEKSIEFLHR